MMSESIAHRANAERLLFSRMLIFFTSFCLMTIEILAGRVTAPYLGVSLYTWTSIIGVILAGVTIGNYVGGLVADRFLSRKTLGLSIALAGCSTLISNILSPALGPTLSMIGWPLPVSILVFSFAVFFPAAFFLSTVSPQVVKFDLHDLERAGVTVGSIGAASAIGSILGTLLTGFIFIQYLGTRFLIFGVAAFLLILGCLVAWQHKIWRSRFSVMIGVFFLGSLAIPSLCQQETNYYCIRAAQARGRDGYVGYQLYLDHLVHSRVIPGQPDVFGYPYEQIQAGLLSYRFDPEDEFSTLTIGGGGYSMPRYIEAFYPRAKINVVEIDPAVTEFNHAKLNLPRTTRIRSIHQDARIFFSLLSEQDRYDVIYEDAVNDYAVPYQITTREFHKRVKTHLSPHGLYAITVIDDPQYAKFTAALVRTLQEIFPSVTLFPLKSDLGQGKGRNTFEIVASFESLSDSSWSHAKPFVHDISVAISDEEWLSISSMLTKDELSRFLAQHPTPILTDDFAPVDHYLAPLFLDAY